MDEPTRQIDAAELTTFDVEADGQSVRINVRDHAGRPAALSLPADCLTQLLMALPKMMQKALHNRYRDPSLRVTYPLESFNVELGNASTSASQQFILTLGTPGGFSVSFSASSAEMAHLGGALSSSTLPHDASQIPDRRLS